MVDVYQVMFKFCTEARKVFVQAEEKKSKSYLRAATPIDLSTMIKLVWKPFKIQFGQCPEQVHAAVLATSLENTSCLLDHGADIQATGGAFRSALQAAVLQSSVLLIRLLLKLGADINARGGRYTTALQSACVAGRKKVTKLLLQKGADPNVVGGRHFSARQAAATAGNLYLVRLLLHYGGVCKGKRRSAWECVDCCDVGRRQGVCKGFG